MPGGDPRHRGEQKQKPFSLLLGTVPYFTSSKEGCMLHWRWSEGHISVLTTSILMIDHPIRWVFSSRCGRPNLFHKSKGF